MNIVKKTYRLNEQLVKDLQAIAAETGQNEAQVIETAMKYYRDYHFLQQKATFINEQIIQVIQASFRMAENNINQKTNQLISELAIQSAIQNLIIGENIDVSQADLQRYRLKALDVLRQKNRVFRMDEYDGQS